MEDNNGRSSIENIEKQEVSIEQLTEENHKLKDLCNKLYADNKQLHNTWMLTRANFLMKAVELEAFDTEFKEKAVAELKEFLFPKPVEQEVKES